MKKLKILSSLALAGALTTGIMGTSFAADAYTSKYGNFKNGSLVANENIAAYILNSATDRVTVKDLKTDYDLASIDGKTIYSEDYNITTGTVIQVKDGTQYKVVIYGDVDKSGKVSSADALEIQKYLVEDASLDSIQKEAADVDREAGATERKITSADALYIQQYLVEANTTPINNPPEVPDPEVQDYNYAITVNENNIINNVNQEDLQIEVSYDKEVAKGTRLKLVAFDATGRRLSISGLPATVTLPEKADEKDPNKMKVTANQNKIDVTKDEEKHQDIIGGYPHISDGTIYFRLFDEEDEKYETPLGETKVTKNTVEPTVAKVSAERSNTDNATFKATRYGKSDITTIYYCAVADNNLKPEKDVVEWNPILKKFSAKATDASFNPETREINVDSNSIEEVINGLSNTNGYKIYYIVENSYGSQTLTEGMSLPSVDVAKDTNTPKEEQVEKINLPTSEGGDFTWDDPHKDTKKDNGYVVTLYKDGEIYHEEVVSDKKFQLRNYSNPTSALEAGEYYIEVVTKGNVGRIESNDTIDSDVVKSDPVTVKAVNPVSNIQLSVDESNGYPKLSWDENDANCGGYNLNLYLEDAEIGVFSQLPNTKCSTEVADNKSIYFSTTKSDQNYTYGTNWNVTGLKGSLEANSTPATLNRNNGYYAEVVATPNSEKMKEEDKNSTEKNIIYVNSQPTYYYFCAPYRDASITDASDNTMTFKLDTITHKNYPYNGATCAYGEEESDLTYAVRVYKKVNESNYQDMGTTEVTTTYDKDKDGNITATYFTVSGLEAYTEYQFRLITKCGEFEGWSDVIANGHTMPRVNGLTCTETDSECKADANNFYSTTDGATVKIEGKEFKANDFDDKGLKKEFTNLKAFLSKLKNGDKVTINGDVIDLELNKNKANSEADASFMYADYLEGKTLNITGSNFERKIGKPKTSEKYPAEVNLKAGQFDLSNFQMNKDEVVTLGNGVKIKTGSTELGNFIVAEGATVTINGVKMTTEVQTAVKAKIEGNNPTLTVVANGEETNNLVFENLNNSVDGTQNDGNVTIKFVSSNGTATTQQGSITIKGNGGKVTVTQENVTVGSDIEVTVEKGEVDVSGDKLTGGKTVTLSGKKDDKTAKITAVATKEVPSVLKGKTVAIKQYESVEALKVALSKNTAVGVEITEEVLAEVNSFLASFGVNSENVKVTLNGTNNIVTIENEGTESVEIQGLK